MVRLIITGFIMGSTAVMMGAFGAHALESFLLEAGRSGTFQVSVNYHFYHTFGIVIIGLTSGLTKNKKLEIAGWFMVVGLVVFSGSLYLLCLTGLKFWGWITPIGGAILVLSWLLAAYYLWISEKKTH